MPQRTVAGNQIFLTINHNKRTSCTRKQLFHRYLNINYLAIMFKRTVLAFLIGFAVTKADAQLYESNVHQGEVGAAIGLAHYFGDLNTSASFRRPKFSAGIFFSKTTKSLYRNKVCGR